ncbi:uncharacterized protein At4g04775-like [Eutrema salsugineum]|uniref:uncharacterized protein At4g04775-like n=1 Tax=Eutrema salsugineum TaxID=72664 RepID=UPI000CED4790|nr:uncharacterized protein At4g04775-like [Eutrema salsugineum]
MTLSQSSDSSRSSNSSRARHTGYHGIPSRCFCGAGTVLVTSHTTTNPGRRFYTCSNSSEGLHVWKWWDEAITEELMELKASLKSLEARVREDEVKTLKELSASKTKEGKEVKVVVALVVLIVSVGVFVSFVK